MFTKSDELAKEVYRVTKNFPKHEVYGMTSQLRRAGLSVILNVVEGFARQGEKEFKRFLLISYGSLKEVKYLLQFSLEQDYISKEEYERVFSISESVAKIIWSIVKK